MPRKPCSENVGTVGKIWAAAPLLISFLFKPTLAEGKCSFFFLSSLSFKGKGKKKKKNPNQETNPTVRDPETSRRHSRGET